MNILLSYHIDLKITQDKRTGRFTAHNKKYNITGKGTSAEKAIKAVEVEVDKILSK